MGDCQQPLSSMIHPVSTNLGHHSLLLDNVLLWPSWMIRVLIYYVFWLLTFIFYVDCQMIVYSIVDVGCYPAYLTLTTLCHQVAVIKYHWPTAAIIDRHSLLLVIMNHYKPCEYVQWLVVRIYLVHVFNPAICFNQCQIEPYMHDDSSRPVTSVYLNYYP